MFQFFIELKFVSNKFNTFFREISPESKLTIMKITRDADDEYGYDYDKTMKIMTGWW